MDNKEQLEHLLTGAFDLHVHSSPDLIPRKMSDIELAKSELDAHMGGILIKCHHGSTTTRATLVRECVPGLKVYGGLVLNRMVGGLNTDAVEAAIGFGAKEIWLPTINAENHVRQLAKNQSKVVSVFDDMGGPLPELIDILDLIAENDIILGTGHLSSKEICKIVPFAKQRGVNKIIITHPEWGIINMPLDVQKHLLTYGVFFERCYYNIISEQQFSFNDLIYQIKNIGSDSTILTTDLGQSFNISPVNGFREFIAGLYERGFDYTELDLMIRKNPKLLLGI